MIGFWVAAALLAAGAAALMLHRAARGGAVARAPDPQVEIYRRALGEIDDLAERDLLGAEERRSVRAEAARRLLGAADRETPPISASGRPTLPLAACAAVAIGAVGVYLTTGSPGLADQPFSARLADWKANPPRWPRCSKPSPTNGRMTSLLSVSWRLWIWASGTPTGPPTPCAGQ